MSKISERRLTTFWWYGAAAISGLLVAATALQVLITQSDPTARLLNHLTLAWEHNLGAWWSGMLLAVVSLHAFDGYVRLRGSKPGPARGWSMLAAVLLFLSFDEVGSLHERLSVLGRSRSLGEWSLLLPLGAVLAAVCLRALALLWQAEGERGKVWAIGLGLLLLGSVAPQEFLEHRIGWQSEMAKAIRVAVEEGTELLSMLVLLRVAMANTAALASRSAADAFAALHELRRPLALLGLALTPALALGAAARTDLVRGNPADWLAGVAFLAAGLVVCRPLLSHDSGIGVWPAWVAGGLCCLASAAAVAIGPHKLVDFGPTELSVRMLVLATVSILVAAAWTAVPAGRGRAYALRAAIVGLLAAVALASTNPMLLYALSPLLGLIVYWVNATVVLEFAARAGTANGLSSIELANGRQDLRSPLAPRTRPGRRL